MLFFWWAHLDIWKKKESLAGITGAQYTCFVYLVLIKLIRTWNTKCVLLIISGPFDLMVAKWLGTEARLLSTKVTVSKLLQLGAPIEWRKTYWKYKVQHSVRRDVGWKKVPQIKNVGQFNFISSNPISRSGSNINCGSTHSMQLLNPNIEIPPNYFKR